jgi:Ulp1 family protease
MLIDSKMTVRTKRRKRIILESDEEEEEDQYTKDEQHVIEIDSDVEEEKGEEKGEEKDTASVFDFPTSSPPRPVLKRYPKRKRISRFAQLTEGKEEQDLLNHPAVINELFQSDDLLIYPYSGKNAVSLRKRDLQRLEEDELLNDALMDIYPKILEETHPEANIHTFSSLFYTRLISKSRTKRGGRITIDHDSVKRWTNNYNLFSKSCLIIPIEQRNHWYLAVVIHPGYCIQKLDQSEEKSIVLDDEEKSIVLDDEEKSIVLDDENEEKNENKSENRSSENDDLYDDERYVCARRSPLFMSAI